MKSYKSNNRGEGEVVVVILAFACISLIVISMFVFPIWNVWRQGLSGEASLKKAQQTRQIIVTQAQAEKEASQMRADATRIVGQAAKEFPEYRQQEFIGAFADALKEGKISQIIYVPTETNIPIMEAGRRPNKEKETGGDE